MRLDAATTVPDPPAHGGVRALAIPYLPFAGVLGFVPLPPALVATVVGITVLYVAATELQKKWFYRRVQK